MPPTLTAAGGVTDHLARFVARRGDERQGAAGMPRGRAGAPRAAGSAAPGPLRRGGRRGTVPAMSTDPLAEPQAPPPQRDRGKRGRGRGPARSLLAKENRRLLLGLLIGAVTAAFAVVNRDRVEVDWLVSTSQTPLIVVIALSFVLGALAGWLAGAFRRRR